MPVSTVVANTYCTNHVLHRFAGAVATPITEDMHPELVLIPLELLQSPLPVQLEAFLRDDPFLDWVYICVSATYAAFLFPTPFPSDVTYTHPSLSIRVSGNLGFFVCRGRLLLRGRTCCSGRDLTRGVSLIQRMYVGLLTAGAFSSAVG